MPRFSSRAKKVADLITYKTDIQTANELINELSTPFDIIYCKFCIIFYYINFYSNELLFKNLKEAEEIQNKYFKDNPDNFLFFLIKYCYFLYYVGVTNVFSNNSIANSKLAKKYYHELQVIYPQIDPYDDWERYFCEGTHYFIIGSYIVMIENNPSKAIELMEKSNTSYSLIPDDGDFLSKTFGFDSLGWVTRLAGKFDDSEKYLAISLEYSKKNKNSWQRFPLYNLTMLYIQKGEFGKAMDLNNYSLKLFKKYNDDVGMYWSLEKQGELSFAEGNYLKALDSYQESLVYRKKHNDGLEIFKGYGNIFNYNFLLYKISKDKNLLIKANQILSECKNLQELYPDDIIIKNYSKYYQACIFKYGNYSKKAKAGVIFEELIKIYPYQARIVSEYLELLFEDYLASEDEETIDKIDSLITKIYDIPFIITSIDSYVRQQIILSNYQFYIKNDIPEAIELLTKAREKIVPYKLEFLNSKIDRNLDSFKQQSEKWANVDISIKERIERSEFNKYIQEAQKMNIL